ncbi:MAG: hypothetical protein J7L96_05200 [Bacteroidales bacterium]|nr:hypothetical protein [Bacteroidales bacterium]
MVDIFPTLTELCGIAPKEGISGNSLVPLLSDPLLDWSNPVITSLGANHYSVGYHDWHYINYNGQEEELYQAVLDNSESIPEDDLVAIEDPTDDQLVDLAVIATAYASVQNPTDEPVVDQIISCASTALGIAAIREIITTTGALITVQSTVALLKVLARRYGFGYIGLAIAIYEFADCMNLL